MVRRSAISRPLRRLVASRADFLCEYCLISEEDTFVGCHVDHVISVKHGGATNAENLAYACAVCNLQKGSDLGSILWRTGELVRFFNPRSDAWFEHFVLEGALIAGQTNIGQVTARILEFNNEPQLAARRALALRGLYPSLEARARMQL